MKIPLVWLWLLDEKHDGFWDWALLKDTFERSRYEFENVEHEAFYKFGIGCVTVLPGRQHAGMEERVNELLSKLEWNLLIITGDEEKEFDVNKLSHPNMVVWAQHRDDTDRRIPNGYTPHTRPNLPDEAPEKTLDFYFGGQVTHPARKVMADQLLALINSGVKGGLNPTDGFAKGDKKSYMESMVKAKVCPCPPGPVIQETFREYEAAEAGAVPTGANFVNQQNFATAIKADISGFPENANRASAKWQQVKRRLVTDLDDTISKLSGAPADRGDITVLIPTSPIKSHPSTETIEETVKSVRDRLPDAEIIFMIDGIRPEQEEYRERYEEYTRRLLWKCNVSWGNTLPLLFTEHTHQAGMTRVALSHVRTPLILFVEQDTPLCDDIPFPQLSGVIMEDHLDVIRFYPEGRLEPSHKHLLKWKKPRNINSQPFVKTIQWSQRPHLAKTAFYKWLIEENFVRPDGTVMKTMIEDKVHGKAHQYPEKYRIGIYHPDKSEVGHIKRSTHLDSREDDPKFSMELQ